MADRGDGSCNGTVGNRAGHTQHCPGGHPGHIDDPDGDRRRQGQRSRVRLERHPRRNVARRLCRQPRRGICRCRGADLPDRRSVDHPVLRRARCRLAGERVEARRQPVASAGGPDQLQERHLLGRSRSRGGQRQRRCSLHPLPVLHPLPECLRRPIRGDVTQRSAPRSLRRPTARLQLRPVDRIGRDVVSLDADRRRRLCQHPRFRNVGRRDRRLGWRRSDSERRQPGAQSGNGQPVDLRRVRHRPHGCGRDAGQSLRHVHHGVDAHLHRQQHPGFVEGHPELLESDRAQQLRHDLGRQGHRAGRFRRRPELRLQTQSDRCPAGPRQHPRSHRWRSRHRCVQPVDLVVDPDGPDPRVVERPRSARLSAAGSHRARQLAGEADHLHLLGSLLRLRGARHTTAANRDDDHRVARRNRHPVTAAEAGGPTEHELHDHQRHLRHPTGQGWLRRRQPDVQLLDDGPDGARPETGLLRRLRVRPGHQRLDQRDAAQHHACMAAHQGGVQACRRHPRRDGHGHSGRPADSGRSGRDVHVHERPEGAHRRQQDGNRQRHTDLCVRTELGWQHDRSR